MRSTGSFQRTMLGILLCAILPLLSFAQVTPSAASTPPAAPNYPPEQIEFYHIDEPYGLLGQPLPKPIQIRVMSKQLTTALGGRIRHPVQDARIRFTLTPDSLARGARLSAEEAYTNPGGIAETALTLGTQPGTVVVEAQILDASGATVARKQLRVVGGLQIEGGNQDSRYGQPLPNPVEIMLEAAPGQPMAGAEISLDLHSKKGKVKPERARTNAEGRASFVVTPGVQNGSVDATMNIEQPAGGNGPNMLEIGQITLSFFGLDITALFVTVIGGLAVFIFGMRQLSNGLQLIAGDRLRRWLNMLTRNRLMGLMAGTIVTGLIQSSSTTSVMVIGFVNAGLFQLKQAISVIFGANIGTTVTAQMISFNLSHLALPSIIVGVLMLLIGKREHIRNWALALIGFGMLFFGLEIMSEPLKSLSNSQLMQSFFSGLNCTPVDGVLPLWPVIRCIMIGAMTTMVVQSSSASIGLLLTLVGSGLLDVWAAFPILLGDNIGTTITAVLASIGSNRTAKRVAVSHVMFNVVGVSVMVSLLFVPWNGHPIFMELVNRITTGNAFAGENVERFLANAHSLFNITSALVFLPFIGVFQAIAFFVVRRTEEEKRGEQFQYLEPHLVNTPSLAIGQVYRELGYMSRQGQRALRIASEMVNSGIDGRFEEQYERIQRREARLDRLHQEVIQYIQQISSQQMSTTDSRYIPRLVQAVNDAERIGDQCVDILKLLRRMHKAQLSFEPEVKEELLRLFAALDQMYERVLQAFETGNAKLIDRVAALRKSIVMMRKEIRQRHIRRLEEKVGEARSAVIVVEMLTYLEAIADNLNQLARTYQEAFQWNDPSTSMTGYRRGPQQLEDDANPTDPVPVTTDDEDDEPAQPIGAGDAKG